MSLYDFADIVDWQGAGYDTSGDWVLGSAVPATGTNGAGLAYNDLESSDLDKEVCARVTSGPAAGSLYVYPDTSFTYTRTGDGSDSFTYQLYVNRAPIGSPQTVNLTVGSGAAVAPGATITGTASIAGGAATGSAAQDATAPGATLTGLATIAGGAASGQVHAVAPGCILIGTASIIPGAAQSGQFARAPAGSGYVPARLLQQNTRSAANTQRPAQTQRNTR